jgi:hypothetical protein
MRIERAAMLALVVALLAMILVSLTSLIIAMVDQPTKFTGKRLLIRGIGAWVTNVLAFSIVYWNVDRGGLEHRATQCRSCNLPGHWFHFVPVSKCSSCR